MEDSSRAPVFLKIEDTKQVIRIMEVIKKKIDEIDQSLALIKEIKKKEDSEIASWKISLNATEGKIAEVDRILFEPEL